MRAARAVTCLPAEAGAHARGVAVEVERDAADRALPPLIPTADWVETHDAAVLGGLHGRAPCRRRVQPHDPVSERLAATAAVAAQSVQSLHVHMAGAQHESLREELAREALEVVVTQRLRGGSERANPLDQTDERTIACSGWVRRREEVHPCVIDECDRATSMTMRWAMRCVAVERAASRLRIAQTWVLSLAASCSRVAFGTVRLTIGDASGLLAAAGEVAKGAGPTAVDTRLRCGLCISATTID